jgi:hypothetical protein
MDNDDIILNFQWLVNLLLTKKHETPRMLIFFRQIKHIAEVYELLETSLGKGTYIDLLISNCLRQAVFLT